MLIPLPQERTYILTHFPRDRFGSTASRIKFSAFGTDYVKIFGFWIQASEQKWALLPDDIVKPAP